MSVWDLVDRFAGWLGQYLSGIPDCVRMVSDVLRTDDHGLILIILLLAALLYRLLHRAI